MRAPHLVVALATPLALAASLGAQQLPPLTQGDAIRLHAPDAGFRRYRTMFVAWKDSSSIVVLKADGREVVPFGSVRRLEVPRGKNRLWSATQGTLFGGAVGALTVLVLCGHEGLSCDVDPTPYLVGAAALGGLIGLAAAPDRWVRVDAPALGFASDPPTPFYENRWFLAGVSALLWVVLTQ